MLLRKLPYALSNRVGRARQLWHDSRQARKSRSLSFVSGHDLLEAHFATWSDLNHVNFKGFAEVLSLMSERTQLIVETGTSAWGTDSTRLWDAYVRHFGGEFWSVDIAASPQKRLKRQMSERTHLVVDDSVHFLTNFANERPELTVDLCYLDSWDLDWSDPEPSASHGLAEWHAIRPLMRKGSILMVDDSPVSLDWVPSEHKEKALRYRESRGYLPGKGALIHQELSADERVRVVWHGYNCVYVFQA